MTIDVSVGGKKKAKEMVLKDMTNKLDSRPLKLKPTWVWPKRNTGKEGGRST